MQSVRTLQKQVEQLRARLAKAKAKTKASKPQDAGRKQQPNNYVNNTAKVNPSDKSRRKSLSMHKWAESGRLIFNYCGKVGHLYRECMKQTNKHAGPSNVEAVAQG